MSKCDDCGYRKSMAAVFDLHWLGEDDCPLCKLIPGCCKKEKEKETMCYERMSDVSIDIQDIAESTGLSYDFLCARADILAKLGFTYEEAISALRQAALMTMAEYQSNEFWCLPNKRKQYDDSYNTPSKEDSE